MTNNGKVKSLKYHRDKETMKELERIMNTEFEPDTVPTVVCNMEFIHNVYQMILDLFDEVCYLEDRIDTINSERKR